MTSNEWAIKTVDLVMRYPAHKGWRSILRRKQGKAALDGVDLRIPPGEVFGLLGPNGAGKTTLLKILSTLVVPKEGRAFVSGMDVVERSLEVRQRVGMIYGDERTFYWRLSALENLRFYSALYRIPWKEAKSRIHRLLDMVGLSEAADLPMHSYSTGMKQRAAIARGLLSDPEIVFMDEPTQGLDPIAAKELRELVRARVADGRRTVVLATNIMAEAEALCDRVALLNNGRVLLTGWIDELREVFQVEESHRIVVSQVDGLVFTTILGVPGVRSLRIVPLEDKTYQLDVAVERESPAVPIIIRHLVEEGGQVWSSTRRKLSLEEIFTFAVNGKKGIESTTQGLS